VTFVFIYRNHIINVPQVFCQCLPTVTKIWTSRLWFDLAKYGDLCQWNRHSWHNVCCRSTVHTQRQSVTATMISLRYNTAEATSKVQLRHIVQQQLAFIVVNRSKNRDYQSTFFYIHFTIPQYASMLGIHDICYINDVPSNHKSHQSLNSPDLYAVIHN